MSIPSPLDRQMPDAELENILRTARLAVVFRQVEAAGFGIAAGASFEAFPGCEDAAAECLERILASGTVKPVER